MIMISIRTSRCILSLILYFQFLEGGAKGCSSVHLELSDVGYTWFMMFFSRFRLLRLIWIIFISLRKPGLVLTIWNVVVPWHARPLRIRHTGDVDDRGDYEYDVFVESEDRALPNRRSRHHPCDNVGLYGDAHTFMILEEDFNCLWVNEALVESIGESAGALKK